MDNSISIKYHFFPTLEMTDKEQNDKCKPHPPSSTKF